MTAQSSSPVAKKDDFIVLPGISLGMLLQIQFEGIGSSQTSLIGLDYGKFIITKTPPMVEIGSKLYQKNHGIVRYLFSGRVYAFRCTLLSLIKEPSRLSILSYPETFENMNLRKHERILCIIAAEVNIKGRTHAGIVSDISMGGCSFEFNQASEQDFPDLNISEKIVIVLHLKEKEEATVYAAIVRAFRKDKESVVIGLQFTASGFEESDAKSEDNTREYLLTLQYS